MVEDDVDKVDELISEGKVKIYLKNEFTEKFLVDLENDLDILKYIKERWASITEYPKRKEIVKLFNEEKNLKNKKIIIFTEFIDTANDLYELIKEECTEKVILYTGKSSNEDMEKVLSNFDANVKKDEQKNDYRILISTDTLSHGVNLHRSNVIINYDIPWNPTKIMQRVGRVQRLGTDFDEVYIYNFFPTKPIEENINIETLAKNKIAMFIELLGNDSQLLTDEPIRSFDLFDRINSDDFNVDEFEDDELKYLHLIRDIRDNDKELFKKIEEIPKKARVARNSDSEYLITLLKTGKFKKVFKSSGEKTEEIDFFEAIKELEALPDEKGKKIDDNYYDYLDLNLNAFNEILYNTDNQQKLSRKENSIINTINAALSEKRELASYDVNFLNKVKDLLIDGHITKNQAKLIDKSLKDLAVNEELNAESTIATLRKNIRLEDLKTTTKDTDDVEIKEIVLSEYFK